MGRLSTRRGGGGHRDPGGVACPLGGRGLRERAKTSASLFLAPQWEAGLWPASRPMSAALGARLGL